MAEDTRFTGHFELLDALEADPDLIPAPDLYPIDEDQLYAASMNRLAQPLPTGQSSPFSSQAPGSAHAVLVENIVWLQALFGHQLNTMTDLQWIRHFQLLNVRLAPARFARINITFTGPPQTTIPMGTQVRSNLDRSVSVFTTEPVTLVQTNETANGQGRAVVSARAATLSGLPALRVGELSELPRPLSGVAAYNSDVVVTGGNPPETLPTAMLRARDELSTGLRAVTARDYYRWAMSAGAEQVAVLRGIQRGARGYFGDLITLAIYPDTAVDSVRNIFGSGEEAGFAGPLAGNRTDFIPAEIVPIDGNITVRARSGISQARAFDLIAIEISQTLNPPHGTWGDQDFQRSVAEACERVDGIIAVPYISLKRSDDDTPLSEVEINPWTLFEIQQSINIELS
jgi:hypothetical protein